MKNESVLAAIRSEFFNYLSSYGTTNSNKMITDWLVSLLKKEMNVAHAAFYIYNEKNEHFSPLVYQDKRFVDRKSLTFKLSDGPVHHCNDNYFILLYIKKDLYGLIELKSLNTSIYTEELLQSIAVDCSKFLEFTASLSKILENKQKYEQLYQLTKKFHSFMKNKDDVLIELISTLQTMYSEYIFYLFLSHDNENKQHLPIKDLDYEKEDHDTAMEAYVTGEVQIERNDALKQAVLYVPLKGKQGVYGVLQVVANNELGLEADNIDFITLLANAAGNALENAQLYEQSKRLIEDLQLINETSHRLNKNLRLTETMSFMSKRILESFQANEVGFFYYDHTGVCKTLPGSTAFFQHESSKECVEYVFAKIERDRDGLFIGDVTTSLEYSTFCSVMVVPMIQSDDIKGCAIVLHKDPYHFSFEVYKLLQSLIHHSTLALTNSLLREELETLVKTDHLTKLYSRNYFNEFIQQSMKDDRQGTFILVDIDDFKQINDTYGHQIGDEVIIQVAELIKSNIRERDIGARWGGEELAIYLPQVDFDSGIAVATRIVKKVGELTNPSITISCGVTYWKEDEEDDFMSLFSRADKALYTAKHNGKNRVVIGEYSQSI
ncbi:diguanylate cyclase domain-containing protein [Metabacillus herbersteinensis]|uniref:Diguanylate cyclase domain-containing protein n=1 Tax=Metabacillus herbersteinensis TaxID=283816 RepID=A0ABV6G9H1_9BACI